MEIVAIIASALMALVTPAGVVLDTLAADALRRQVAGVDDLSVRIDNVPNYQVIHGRIDQVRLAARGIYPRQLPDLRIAAIDLETDPVAVDVGALQRGQLKLNTPAQAALRLRLQATDINAFLASPQVQTWLDTLQFSLPGEVGAREQQRYGLANPTLEFLDGDRFRLMVDLEDRVLADTIPIVLETGVAVVNGHRLELIQPRLEIEGELAPPGLVTTFAEGASQEFSLRRLEAWGLTSRILAFNVRDNELDIALFARLDPNSPFLQPQTSPEQTP
ncbi:DUF2993 domain-containing protein [Phormidium sp. FACHB-1136]|uniref:LmeA family phospholipid-binding protein n=1 Tax=Phormidium sp. FACHB-1136 TaxID=2692848 RepID=UPI0016865124|nr:DUF2993 domain-containing protein [Phormidium sp. FACHB-1136]MBD2425300.1 DUF2993 domain-containing protein [Phormidium sp. FACHB-1136]